MVTCVSLGNYTANADSEDDRLFRFLKDKGHQVSFQIWEDERVDWSAFDVAIVKSPWDYFDKIEAFYIWLHKMEQQRCQVLNPVKTIRWNADKIYFRDLEKQGVSVVPSYWLEQGSEFNAAAIFEELGTPKIIVKPRVSGGSKNTFALNKTEAASETAKINELLQKEGFLAQPFLEEIKTKGEWSFLFFGGKYSHAVLKTAKPGDFRVQHFLGGSVHTPEPPAHLLATAEDIALKFASDCLYARVDGVEINGRLVLMELELIEPFLFLSTNTEAIERYYAAMLDLLAVQEVLSR
ncbi:hypothetical protein C1N53_13935 [Pontibacter sp. SGAir0037]|nr:hypothetical protein C1N53_13935 [Pontibacter sp. SGAir0037]